MLLTDGRLGRVARAGRSLDRPSIRTFPHGELLDLELPALAGIAVQRLLDEPEFVQLLMTSKDGKVVDEPKAPLPSEPKDDPAATEARDEELAMTQDDGCDHQGHSDDCRLC